MISSIKTIALAAGADAVIYDRPSMQNVLVDDQAGTTIALIDERTEVNHVVRSNGVDETMILVISFVRQVDFAETAELNATDMDQLLVIARKFILGLVNSRLFRKSLTSTTIKFREAIMDRNLIGWQLRMTLPILEGYAEC